MMAISTHFDRYEPNSCGGAECMRRAGDQARMTVEKNTRIVTEEAIKKTMEAEASMKASAAIVQVHIDRIVALELEVARLRAAAAG